MGRNNDYSDAITNAMWQEALDHVSPAMWKSCCEKVEKTIMLDNTSEIIDESIPNYDLKLFAGNEDDCYVVDEALDEGLKALLTDVETQDSFLSTITNDGDCDFKDCKHGSAPEKMYNFSIYFQRVLYILLFHRISMFLLCTTCHLGRSLMQWNIQLCMMTFHSGVQLRLVLCRKMLKTRLHLVNLNS